MGSCRLQIKFKPSSDQVQAEINISVGYQYFCTKPPEQGLFFRAGQNESKQWYATIKTYKNINISARYQYFCTKPSEQGLFFRAGQNESKQWYAMIKTYKNINISTRYQYFCMKPSGLIFPSQSK